MGGVFHDIEAAGQQLRRTRVFRAIWVTGALIVATLYVFRDVGYFLLSVYAVALPILFVVESWLGLHARNPSLRFFDHVYQQALNGAVFAAMFGVAFMSARKSGFEWNDLVYLLGFLFALAVRFIYSWREFHRATNNDFAKDNETTTLLSRSGIAIHFAGYAVGLAAALTASTAFNDDESHLPAYAGSFLIGKLASDLLWPPPASLTVGSPSRVLSKMTALSPLLWGVPWGLLVAVYFFLFIWHPKPHEVAEAAVNAAWLVAAFAVAVTLVFGVLTAVTYAHDLLSGARNDLDGEALASDRFWTLHFWAVVSLALAGTLFLIEPFELSDEEVFGEETWTCAKKYEEYQVAWVGRSGVRIGFNRHSIDLFNVSCVPTSSDKRLCDYDDEGWEEVTIVVSNPNATETIVFDRKTPGVQSNYRHHADIYGDLADAIVGAFRSGTSARMIIRAGKGRLLYEKVIDLKGFTKAQNACQARWG